MKKLIFFLLACAGAAEAPMGSTTDWWAFGGDARRDGWEKSEQRFTKDEVKDFRLLWEHEFINPREGVATLQPPVVLGRLIGYRGFKELAFIAGSGNGLWSIDSDLDRMYWERHFPLNDTSDKKRYQAAKQTCGGDLTAVPALPGPIVFHAPVPGKPASSAIARSRGVRPVFMLTGDGMLRQLNQEDGSDLEEPRQFVPLHALGQALNVSEDVVYTSTRAGCGHEAAVWSIDTADPEAKVKSARFGADIAGLGGVVLNGDGMAFVQTDDGPLDPPNGKYGDSLLMLDKDLAVSQFFVVPAAPGKKTASPGMNVTPPMVFTFNGVELIVTTGKDGRLYVLKTSELGAPMPDHHHYISKTMVIPAFDDEKAHGIWGGLASWEDADGSRYVLATVWGPLSPELQAAFPDAHAPNGSIVVFKLQDKETIPTLVPLWVSRDLDSPTPPVIAKGVVFVLANGKFSHSGKGPMPRKGTHATLFAFDGISGKDMYATGDQLQAAGNLAGITVANGRVYVLTVDNTLHVFGKYLER